LKGWNSVPELTRSAGIQLNDRVSLRRSPDAISVSAPDIAPSGPTHGEAVGDHTPLAALFSKSAVKEMTKRPSSRRKAAVVSRPPSPTTIEQQFLELKKLRKRVEELQQMGAKAEAAKRNRPPN
jgi:hypothetical protein